MPLSVQSSGQWRCLQFLMILLVSPILFGFVPLATELQNATSHKSAGPTNGPRSFLIDHNLFGRSNPITMGRIIDTRGHGDGRHLLELPTATSVSIQRRRIEEELERSRAITSRKIVSYDIPVVINDKVVKWLEYFQGRGRHHFARWLSRYRRYSPMIRHVLRQNSLPEDLVFLAMIESGFQPFALSRARAVGLWQFMRATGSSYGLKVNWWVDERRDPYKATIAAARHMRDLFERYQSWYLVAASYNAGQSKIDRAIRRYKTEDFWEMSRYRYLKRETKEYVPKLLAAAIISKNPQAYGFRGIAYERPIVFDSVELTSASDLKLIAKVLGVSVRSIQRLNPELKRTMTPPHYKSYNLRVPAGSAPKLIAKLDKVKVDSAKIGESFVRYRVRRGDSLWTIARRFDTSVYAIQDLNNLKRARSIRAGSRLMIPTKTYKKRRPSKQRISRKKQRSKVARSKGFYKVRRGDNLWRIAQRFHVRVRDLRRWNDLGRSSRIYAGDLLKVRPDSPS